MNTGAVGSSSARQTGSVIIHNQNRTRSRSVDRTYMCNNNNHMVESNSHSQHHPPQNHAPLHTQVHNSSNGQVMDTESRCVPVTRVWTHPSQIRHRNVVVTKSNQLKTNRNRNTISTIIDSSGTGSGTRCRQHRPHIQPLVLDASASPSRLSHVSTYPDPCQSVLLKQQQVTSSTSSSRITERIITPRNQSITTSMNQQPPLPQIKVLPSSFSSNSGSSNSNNKSGYLYKLGTNISIYKRRFFTLHSPSTLLLYYYISPYDTEPRGCYNIMNGIIEHDLEIDDNDDDISKSCSENAVDIVDTTASPGQTYKFAIVWNNHDRVNDNNNSSNSDTIQQPHREERVELEARSKQDAIQWIRMIQKQQMSQYAVKQLHKKQVRIRSYEQQINELQKQINNYKYIEQERDDAMNDAIVYQQQFKQLDESIQLYTQKILRSDCKQASSSSNTSSTDVSNKITVNDTNDNADLMTNKDKTADTNDIQKPEDVSTNAVPNDAVNDPITSTFDVSQVPGNHFVELYNTVEHLQEQILLSSIETKAAHEDLAVANQSIKDMEQRNHQMEQHLCQIWEENCSLRKRIKQVKKEKRIVVREIKSLRDTISAGTGSCTTSTTTTSTTTNRDNDMNDTLVVPSKILSVSSKAEMNESKNFTEEFLNASDEDKLIQELEEHVLSSIRLHEELLSSTIHPSTTIIPDIDLHDEYKYRSISIDSDIVNLDSSSDHPKQKLKPPTLHPNVPLFEQYNAPIASLFDNDDDEDNEDTEDDNDIDHDKKYKNNNENYIEHHNHVVEEELETNTTTPTTNTTSNKIVAPLTQQNLIHVPSIRDSVMDDDDDDEDDDDLDVDRPNPLLHLYDDEHHATVDQPKSLSQSSNLHNITGKAAVYQLSCPLTDAIAASTSTSDIKGAQIPIMCDIEDEMKVYHITFYSRKIGIQFQRVPPTPVKPNGLLTEAMTDDLTTTNSSTLKNKTSTTIAELRRIAAISKRTKSTPGSSSTNLFENESCDVATPVDAVLVCGFYGFDEANLATNSSRPKLGARLVAFDGVSIEIGKWTFAAVRKAIQSCGRPLTLSFRNDYLTKVQRAILTKAVLDVDLKASSSSSSAAASWSHHHNIKIPQSSLRQSTPTLISPTNHNAIQLDGESKSYKDPVQTAMTDDMSESADGGSNSDYLNSFPQSFSGNRSVTSLAHYRSFYETRSYGSSSHGGSNRKDNKIRSFSEAGGSATTTTTNSSVLSAIGPLVTNLLYRPLRPTKEPFTPEYLRRAPEFVEETPQHQDFQSELL